VGSCKHGNQSPGYIKGERLSGCQGGFCSVKAGSYRYGLSKAAESRQTNVASNRVSSEQSLASRLHQAAQFLCKFLKGRDTTSHSSDLYIQCFHGNSVFVLPFRSDEQR
jgi:hypothetical protein